MKILFCLLILTLSTVASAKVTQAGADSMDHDLGFSIEQAVQRDREIASEEPSQVEEAQDSEADRNIASDVVESEDSRMQYWKY